VTGPASMTRRTAFSSPTEPNAWATEQCLEPRNLDLYQNKTDLTTVSVLEIKQSLSRLSSRELSEVQLYLHRLKRATPAWKKATAKKIQDVQRGKFTTLAQLEERHRRG